MLTTGVDARNVRNIVLTTPIGSMVEFKQIIGRGTRVFEGKDFFTIIDFVGATNLFYDKDWDGEPEGIEESTEETEEKSKREYSKTPEIPVVKELDEELKTKEKLIVELSNGRQLRVTDIETRY